MAKTSVVAKVMLVTPEIASKWLANNFTNRSIFITRVKQYADVMKRGGWQLNGEAIEISASGKLKNGQHRLSAIVMSGCSVMMLVVFGIDDAVSIYDRGRGRSVADVLRIEGLPTALANNAAVGAARLHFLVQKWEKAVSDEDIRAFLIEHSNSLESIYDVMPTKNKKGSVNVFSSPFILASLYAFESGVAIETIGDFLECVNTGLASDKSQHAAIVFRNDMLVEKLFTSRSSEGSRREMVFKIEKALYDFAAGTPRKQSYNKWSRPVYSSNDQFQIKGA